MLLLWRRRYLLVSRATAADYVLAAFIVLIVASTAAVSRERLIDALGLLGAYLLLPYAAARFLRREEIHRFIAASAILGLAAIPLSLVEIDGLSAADLSRDRIPNFLGAYYTLNDTGLLLGSYLVLAVALLFAQRQWTLTLRRLVLWTSLLVCVTLISVLGARGGLVAALAVCFVAPFLPWPSTLSARALVIVALSFSVVVSFVMMPGARKTYFQQVLAVAERSEDAEVVGDRAPTLSMDASRRGTTGSRAVEERTVRAAPQRDDKRTNSASVRTHLFGDAIAALRVSPAIGVGASRFGENSPTQRAMARNSICYDYENGRTESSRSYRCTRPLAFASPHSTVLHALSELGVIGGSLFIALVLCTARVLWRLIRTEPHSSLSRDASVLGLLWMFYFLSDQFYGSYFTSFQFYLLTGSVIAIGANTDVSKLRTEVASRLSHDNIRHS
jgi:O-antigen ligase